MNSGIESIMLECQECVVSQKFRSRNRRSYSCPDGQYPSPVSSQSHCQTSSLIKRWHSISDIQLDNTGFTKSSINLSQQSHQPSNDEPTDIGKPSNTFPNISRLDACKNYRISTSLPLSKRFISLFVLGNMFAVLLNFLQIQNKVTVFPPGVFADKLNSAWWVPPTFGLAAAVIGLLYPKLDTLFGYGEKHQDWSSVMRCIATFVGINHASAKIAFDSNTHLFITLALLSLGLWYFFDQSLPGLGVGVAVTVVAAIVTQCLVAFGVFGYSDPDFMYMRSWVLCLYFSGGITIGTVGRALVTFEDGKLKQE